MNAVPVPESAGEQLPPGTIDKAQQPDCSQSSGSLGGSRNQGEAIRTQVNGIAKLIAGCIAVDVSPLVSPGGPTPLESADMTRTAVMVGSTTGDHGAISTDRHPRDRKGHRRLPRGYLRLAETRTHR